MKNKLIVIGILSLFLLTSTSSISIIGMTITKENNNKNTLTFFDENDAEAPIWNVSHSWTYEVTINGGIPSYVNINNLKMNDLTFNVEQVHNDSYTLSFSADITGSGSVKLSIITLSGQLIDTEMQGKIVVNKSKLTIIEVQDLIADGYIKPPILPKIHIDAEGDSLLTYGTPLLNFPINNYDSWFVDVIPIVLNLTVNVELLPDPIEVQDTVYIEEHFAECHEWDIVNVAGVEYDALRLSTDLGDEHIVWYSVAAGNVIKLRGRDIPLNWGYSGEYDIDITLKSTNFYIDSNPPSTPSDLSGPSEVVAGYPEEFTAGGSIDPDGDMVRYIIDWGDGIITGSDFVPSGENITANYYWTKKGEYIVKVKARDKYGAQSEWSDPIIVIVLNDPPLKPEPPTGPLNGKIKKPYTYSATSTDPDGHRIKFKFDWGDGKTSYSGFVNSGDTGSATHSWSKKGTYSIKVKAIDEWGEESGWSEPLSVTMPRNRVIYNPFLNWLQNHLNIFSILRLLLQRFGLQ